MSTQRDAPRLLLHSLSATQGSQVLTEFTAVFVQAFVPGLQELPPQVASLATVH